MVRSVALLAALVVTATILGAGSGAVRAEGVAGESAQSMAGGWEISNADRDRRCPLTFSADTVPGGYKIDFDAECSGAFPSLTTVIAWGFGPNDVVRLLDAKGGAVMEFTEVENGMYESERGADGLLFLQT